MTTINLSTFRQPGETDIDALARAMADTSPTLEIYFPAGGGASGGVYEISTNAWVPGFEDQIPGRGNITRGNVTLSGDGMYQTIIRQPASSELMFMAHCDPNAPTNLIPNITIRDMSLIGNLSARLANAATYSYNQHNHLVRLAGFSNFRAERVEFKDFMGDGLNLSSPLRTLVPHNVTMTVTACRFDGVNKKNRNAISILDCDGWTITGCAFLNVSDSSRASPGAIDIEPETAGSIIKSGVVYNSSFENLGGYAVALLNGVGATATGLQFTYCKVCNSERGVIAVGGYNNVTAANLYVEHVVDPVLVSNASGTTIKDNTFRDANVIRLSGGSTNVLIQNNGLVNCGKTDGAVILQDGGIDGVQVLNNHAIDCGSTSVPVSPFYFVTTVDGAVKNLRVNGNVIEAYSGPLKITDIGRVVGGRLPSAVYQNVNRDNNTPSAIPNGAENLVNHP